jgi:hypothetical protein
MAGGGSPPSAAVPRGVGRFDAPLQAERAEEHAESGALILDAVHFPLDEQPDRARMLGPWSQTDSSRLRGWFPKRPAGRLGGGVHSRSHSANKHVTTDNRNVANDPYPDYGRQHNRTRRVDVLQTANQIGEPK